MLMLFCSDPLHPRRPDPAYAAEVAAAAALDLPWALIDFEALTSGATARAVRMAPEQASATLGLYRGWMSRPTHYSLLYRALSERNIYLINDPASYTYCHYLPECYAAIEEYTPRTVWLHGTAIDMDRVLDLVRPFGDAPLVVKDFVKSRKHEWKEACYIPSATDRAAVTRVVSRFLALQGEDLAEGLVFRQFIDFVPIGRHAVSGMRPALLKAVVIGTRSANQIHHRLFSAYVW